jgi:hypothetical protein
MLPADDDITPADREFFETKVRPLLVERCHKCHGADKQEAGLRLDARESILAGGDTGPALVPGKPDESELIRAIRYEPDGYQMPPDAKLPEADIATLTRWVERGAPWPGSEAATAVADEAVDLAERARRWSFQPLIKPALPQFSPPDAPGIRSAPADWCRNPLDRFVLAKLLDHGLMPAPAADRSTLLRRAAFDVLGLPPSPEQAAAFVADGTPEAYERLVDELLASPRFGERWGRHWLDLVRYADSRGHEFDFDVANAWQYRDYVIRALNDDVPFDQFVVEQIAGDLLEPAEEGCADADSAERPGEPVEARRPVLRLNPHTGANESLLGTGFWFLGEWVHSPVDIRGEEAERFANMLDVYGKAFLGLTVACARCHDHKFDPITQRDFYALQGYLQSAHYRQARFETLDHNRRIAAELEENRRQAAAATLPVCGRLITTAAADLPRILLAARTAISAHPEWLDLSRGTWDAAAVRDALGANADGDGDIIPRERTAAWVEHLLRTARQDERDPFHLWARSCSGDASSLEEVNGAVAAAARRADEQWEQLSEQEDQFFRESRAVELLPESEGGLRVFPRVPLLTDDPRQPYARFEERPLAMTDPLLSSLAVREGTQAEPGATGEQPNTGRTCRTETVSLDKPLLHLRLRGGCTTYLGVDSHRLIKGPLHGDLYRVHPAPDGEPDRPRWVTLDVSRYQGHRAHLEITALPGTEFALFDVRLADGPPPGEDVGPGWAAISSRETTSEGAARFQSAEELAAALCEPFTIVDGCLDWFFLAPGTSGSCSLVEAQWAVEHPALFGLTEAAARDELARVAGPFVLRQDELVQQLRTVSASAPAMVDGSGEDEYVFIRGNWKKQGETVRRRPLEVFGGLEAASGDDGSGRLELAGHMVDPERTPILPRVIVNRIWQHYFGVGIVPTPDDFGYMGQDPTHPELLDWLACELVEHDWSLKHIHRLILTSAVYRRSSAATDVRAAQIDPGNRLLQRMNVKRLEGEAIRDALLAVSGRLDERTSGTSVPVHLTPFLEGRGRPAESGPVDGAGRRSVYLAVRRNFPDPFLQAFDMPNPHTTVGRRNVSNVPAQSLAMMNSPLVIEQSQHWAASLPPLTATQADIQQRIRRLYQAAFGRPATDADLQSGLRFIEQHAEDLGTDISAARVWADYCHALFNTKEFLFVR